MIIYKLLDPRQYKFSPGYKNIELEKVIKNHKTLDFYDLDYFDFFASADCVETDLNFEKQAKYIIPFFYNHAEKIDTLNLWKQTLREFIADFRHIFSYATLAICDPLESSTHFINTVEEFKKDIDLIAITANKKYKQGIYTDSWIHRFPANKDTLKFKGDKLYINLNRVARYHRCKLLDSLISNNLQNLGYNTWGDVYGKFEEYKKQHITNIHRYNWDKLDVTDLSSINPNNTVPINSCKESFLYIATETLTDSNNLFFSEKTYKPIGLGMPFITLGNPGTLDDLKTRGYKTFSNWWNEEYDKNLSLDERIQIIIDNLNYLKTKDLQILRKEIDYICQHNLELYKIEKTKNKLRGNLNAMLNNS